MSHTQSTVASFDNEAVLPPATDALDFVPAHSGAQVSLLVQTAEQNRRQLLWLAERITKNHEEAEDIVQDSIIKAMRSLHNFRGDAKMGTWLRVIVQNTACEWLRRRGARVYLPLELTRADEDDSGAIDLPDLAPTPEEWCERAEIVDLIQAELACLTLFSRSALQLCSIEGRSLSEASQALNLSVITVKSRIFRGKRLLRKRIARAISARPKSIEKIFAE